MKKVLTIITLTIVLILNIGAKSINTIHKNNQCKYMLPTKYRVTCIDPNDEK